MPILTVKRVMIILLMNKVCPKDNTGFNRDLMILSAMECVFFKYREMCKRVKKVKCSVMCVISGWHCLRSEKEEGHT